ncbi:hypothetical protein HHK36_024603 [Tetracentron sinense]|uniref:Two-component response regulator n=1 Tax=Tetracentron sinense TaxID=13715 RepID=A0A834YQA9_TETSI|nr:hypothetical protein HHK36_024603 [Tetracentron sinense]
MEVPSDQMIRLRSLTKGLRVLLVDCDTKCRESVADMLESCSYKVMSAERASVALYTILERRDQFDLVIVDVDIPDMDGLTLTKLLVLDMDMPVILMCANEDVKVAKRAIENGACSFLMKPITIHALKNIWQHVFRTKRLKIKEIEEADNLAVADREKISQGIDCQPLPTTENGKQRKPKRKRPKDDKEKREDDDGGKKSQMCWTEELQLKFITAIYQLGEGNAVPSKIHELMKIPNLTRKQIASHLQKYRIRKRRLCNMDRYNPHSFEHTKSTLKPDFYYTTGFSQSLERSNPMAFQGGPGNNFQGDMHDIGADTMNMIHMRPQVGLEHFGGGPIDDNFRMPIQENNEFTRMVHMASFGRLSELPSLDYKNNTGGQIMSNRERHDLTPIRAGDFSSNGISLNGIMPNDVGVEKFALGIEEISHQIPELSLPNLSYATPGMASPTSSPKSNQSQWAFTGVIHEPDVHGVIGSEPDTGALGSLSDLLDSSMFEDGSLPQQYDEFDLEEVFPELLSDGAAVKEPVFDISSYIVDEGPPVL